MELKITKEKVLEAASKCSTAKETLKTLFPEAWDYDVRIVQTGPENSGCFTNNVVIHNDRGGAADDEFLVAVKGDWIQLNGTYSWSINPAGYHLQLIPTKK